MKNNLDDFTMEITKKIISDAEKLKNKTLQNSRKVKETSTQDHFWNMVAGGEVKDDAMPCCVLAYLASVTMKMMKNEGTNHVYCKTLNDKSIDFR